MHCAARVIARIIVLECRRELQGLDPLGIGQILRETVDAYLGSGHEVRTLSFEAGDHCEAVKDQETRALREGPIADKGRHGDVFETQTGVSDSIGEAPYDLLLAAPANEAKA